MLLLHGLAELSLSALAEKQARGWIRCDSAIAALIVRRRRFAGRGTDERLREERAVQKRNETAKVLAVTFRK